MWIKIQAVNTLKLFSIISLFLWISFFAPLIGSAWRPQFLFVLTSLLLIAGCLDVKAAYKSIFSKQGTLLWIFLLTMLGGLVNGTNPKIAYQYFWDSIFIVPFLYFFAKTTFQKEYGIIILRAICLMGLLVCVLGIIEFTARENFIYRNMIDNLYYNSFKGRRMMSLHMHPAPLATYLTAIFPLAVVLILKEKKVFLKLLAIIYAAIIFISIVLTFTRGAFLGVSIAMLIMVSFLFKRNKIIFIPLLVAAIIAISSFLFHLGYSPFYRLDLSGLSAPIIYSSKIGRFISIGNILKDHPFFGLGFGHYRIYFDHYLPYLANVTSLDSKVPDCMYIALLAETGLIGFSSFILLIYFLLKRAWLKLKLFLRSEERLVILGFLSGFIAILCAFLTYDGLYWIAPSYLFWSYLGILSSQIK